MSHFPGRPSLASIPISYSDWANMHPFSPTLNPPSATIRLASAPSATLLAATTAESVATSSATSTQPLLLLSTRTPSSTLGLPFLVHVVTASRSSRTGTAATAAELPVPHPRMPPTPSSPLPLPLVDRVMPSSFLEDLRLPPVYLGIGTGAPSKEHATRHTYGTAGHREMECPWLDCGLQSLRSHSNAPPHHIHPLP